MDQPASGSRTPSTRIHDGFSQIVIVGDHVGVFGVIRNYLRVLHPRLQFIARMEVVVPLPCHQRAAYCLHTALERTLSADSASFVKSG